MFKKKELLVILILAVLVTGLSWQQQERISSEGFFSLYQGATYIGYGYPWWFWRCYKTQGCSFLVNYFILDILFWFLVLAAGWWVLKFVLKKIKIKK